MKKMWQKKVTSLILILALLVVATSGCSKKSEKTSNTKATVSDDSSESSNSSSTSEDKVASGKPKTIRWGSHWIADLDPNYKDPTTGEYVMDESSRQAALKALDEAKKKLNVNVEFVQYASDTRSELITSVLAGKPVCDIAVLWGGCESTILSQNIVQPLDKYADMFTDDEYSWMFFDKVYGHNYFLTNRIKYLPRWPLVYNASMIEKVDSLKDKDGKTIYPTKLYLDGKWTWNTFKDYLSKIQTYYANTKSPESCAHDKIQAYETDYRYAGLSAIYSAGGTIYGKDGYGADSKETIKATKFVKDLMEAKVMSDPGLSDNGYSPEWTKHCTDFQAGGTVFTDCGDWLISGAASAAGERNESLGVVPWPRPDEMAADDPNYHQVLSAGDTMVVLKGVDDETTKLALEFIKLYMTTYYKTLGGVDSMKSYLKSSASTQATSYGFDIFNESYGDDLLKTFGDISTNLHNNDFADLLGLKSIWDDIYGKSLYGIEGTPSYDVAIASSKDQFTKKISEMESILASGKIRDNMPPDIEKTQSLAFPKGTDAKKIKFEDYIAISDAIDGVLDSTQAKYDYSKIDFKKVGKYEGGLSIKMSDKSGNEGSSDKSVVVYNPDNKKAPKVTIKKDYRTLTVDEDASAIKWKDDFIESAVDADGIDVAENVTADISSLDTTTAGEYDVVITVSDFAGNKTNKTIKVKVEAKSEDK